MKTHTFLAAFVTLVTLTGVAMAVDMGASARQGSLFNGDSGKRLEAVHQGGPRLLSVGVSSLLQKREMDYDNLPGLQKWDARHLMVSVGFDVFPWLTAEGGIGQSSLNENSVDQGSDVEWMGGGQIRLLDYMLTEPPIGNDAYWFGLDLGARYSAAQAGDLKWGEMFGSVTMSFTVRPERYGFMDRISLYFGPAYSDIRGKDSGLFGGDISADQSTGFIGGVVLVPSDNFTIKLEAQSFGEMSMGASFGFHF
jgi:hypothetical protein